MEKRIDMLTLQKRLASHQPFILDHEQFTKSAVLIPLIKLMNQWHLLFEVRSEQLRSQPGEICFPGGRIDASDPSARHTAVRETCEELGIQESSIEVWGGLDYLVTPFNLIIYPFVAVLDVNRQSIQPNPAEVGQVFYVPLDFLLTSVPDYYELELSVRPKADFPLHLIPQQENYDWRMGHIPEYFYFYQEYVIWGITARILHHFLEVVKDVQTNHPS